MKFLLEAQVDAAKSTGKTRHYSGSRMLATPAFLRIAQIPPDAGYYLLYYDRSGKEMTDTYHDTIEAAQEQAAMEFQTVVTDWKVLDAG